MAAAVTAPLLLFAKEEDVCCCSSLEELLPCDAMDEMNSTNQNLLFLFAAVAASGHGDEID